MKYFYLFTFINENMYTAITFGRYGNKPNGNDISNIVPKREFNSYMTIIN